jgi:carbonic anhydrase
MREPREIVSSEFPARLIEGYEAFVSGRLPEEQQRFQTLAEGGQSPKIMLIGCCDSRVSPEVIFDARPGEMFVVRNVANLVPPYTPDGAQRAVSAALEFAVQALRVQHIVVLGHAQCGGIRAFTEDSEPLSPGDFIGSWMKLLAPAAADVGARGDMPLAEYLTRLEKASILHTIENLKTFPCVRILHDKGKLQLHAAYFGVATGALSVYDWKTKEYRPVAAKAHAEIFAAPRF